MELNDLNGLTSREIAAIGKRRLETVRLEPITRTLYVTSYLHRLMALNRTSATGEPIEAFEELSLLTEVLTWWPRVTKTFIEDCMTRALTSPPNQPRDPGPGSYDAQLASDVTRPALARLLVSTTALLVPVKGVSVSDAGKVVGRVERRENQFARLTFDLRPFRARPDVCIYSWVVE